MSYLSMMESRLPPGFRFQPRDDELVCDYLVIKLNNQTNFNGNLPLIIDVDLNKCEPWQLPEVACVGGKEWYFFSLRDRKYATGHRTNRATESGYWKATGKDRKVYRKGVLVGMRKTLVFYRGRAPKGNKTDWVMHEFRMEGFGHQTKFHCKDDWVLCRVFYKSRASSTTNIEPSYDDEMGSSILPSLTDTYITFEQAPLEGYEQVPCFSNISHNSAGRSTNDSLVPLVETNISVKNTPIMTDLSDFGPSDTVLKAVLNHFKLVGNPKNEYTPKITNQGSVDNYLSENGSSCM